MAYMIKLKGITWNHSRGYIPLVATAQHCKEMNSKIEIVWKKHSLQAFADVPTQVLANE